MPYPPLTASEMLSLGIDRPDFVLVTGDAYVDHPAFGAAIITRVLMDEGYSVCVLSQPDWKTDADFRRFGQPRFGFMVTSGNIDSMVAHYTAARRKRSDDPYSPGGKGGHRPDRAVIVYCQMIKKAWPDSPIVVGGLEASLRRFAHYDYWDDAVRPSVLAECGADLLIFGMGERAVRESAGRLSRGEALFGIRGTCVMADSPLGLSNYVALPSYDKVKADKAVFARAVAMEYKEQDAARGKTLVQPHGERQLIQFPPAAPLTRRELDGVYALPYERSWHPLYEKEGGVPAIAEVEFSIIHNRGCFGACAFCALALHQGRTVTSRSRESVLAEARAMTENPRFKGYIHDVGGPTANMRNPSCGKQIKEGVCPDRRCLAPTPCPHLVADHSDYLKLLRELRELPGVKKVFIRSGIRYDYMLADKKEDFFKELVRHHVSGQLKVAPEHVSERVLGLMGKPSFKVYERFAKRFFELSRDAGLEQYLVPYLMSSHPGSTLRDAVELAVKLKELRLKPEQVQDFYPTPGTLSTCMFYTGLDPMTGKPVYVPRSPEEKRQQRALLQFSRPENHGLVREALRAAGRADLIGGPNGLVPPEGGRGQEGRAGAGRPAKPGKPRPGGKGGAPSRAGTKSRPSSGKKSGKR